MMLFYICPVISLLENWLKLLIFWQDEEPDYGSRRMAGRRRFEDELEAEALAERRIINAKKVSSCAHDYQFYFSQTFSIYMYLFALHIFSKIWA